MKQLATVRFFDNNIYAFFSQSKNLFTLSHRHLLLKHNNTYFVDGDIVQGEIIADETGLVCFKYIEHYDSKKEGFEQKLQYLLNGKDREKISKREFENLYEFGYSNNYITGRPSNGYVFLNKYLIYAKLDRENYNNFTYPFQIKKIR